MLLPHCRRKDPMTAVITVAFLTRPSLVAAVAGGAIG
jgi:hypothetical protein